jgi:hypothetical protein
LAGDYTQDYINEKTIALGTRTGKMTASVLKSLLMKYLSLQKQKKEPAAQSASLGKTSLKKLQERGDTLSSIEITDQNIKSFERVARKYNVTFALKKDSTQEPPKYIVFFRGRDTDVLQQAFQEYTRLEKKLDKKPSIRQRLAKALQQSLNMGRHRQKQRSKEKSVEPEH